MGHEFCRFIEDGRRVVVNPLLSCGHCDSCDRGAAEISPDRKLLGLQRAGGFAERAAVPQSALHELPDDHPWESAALVEPLANAVHAFGMVEPGMRRVGVLGARPIGLAGLLVGRARGHQVHVADLDHRCSVANRLGATQACDRLVGEFDAGFDAVGTVGTHEAAVVRLRPGGTAVWLGLRGARAELGAASDAVRGQRGSFVRLATVQATLWRRCGWHRRLNLIGRKASRSMRVPRSSTAYEGDHSVAKALLRPYFVPVTAVSRMR